MMRKLGRCLYDDMTGACKSSVYMVIMVISIALKGCSAAPRGAVEGQTNRTTDLPTTRPDQKRRRDDETTRLRRRLPSMPRLRRGKTARQAGPNCGAGILSEP